VSRLRCFRLPVSSPARPTHLTLPSSANVFIYIKLHVLCCAVLYAICLDYVIGRVHPQMFAITGLPLSYTQYPCSIVDVFHIACRLL
jgi:hypothetical protein